MTSLAEAQASATRLQEVRRAARDIRGEHYAQDMVAFKQAIRNMAAKLAFTHMEAAMQLADAANRSGNTTDFMLFMAAFVELTEECAHA